MSATRCLLCFAILAAATQIADAEQLPSFNCGKATTAAERVICGSPELSSLDGRLGALFRRLRNAAPADWREGVLTEQRSWIIRRNRGCGLDRNTILRETERAQKENCFQAAYHERIAALEKDLAPQSADLQAAAKHLSEQKSQDQQIGTGIQTDQTIQGRCSMDVCSWMRPIEQKIVQANEYGSLVKIEFAYGKSIHPNGSYEQKRPIEWGKSDEGYVYCSKSSPAVIFKSDIVPNKGWFAHVLAPGYSDGVFGYNTSTYRGWRHDRFVRNQQGGRQHCERHSVQYDCNEIEHGLQPKERSDGIHRSYAYIRGEAPNHG